MAGIIRREFNQAKLEKTCVSENAVKERPILFSGEMVRAILEGRKTQTRRVVKPQGAIVSDAMARSLGVQPPKIENTPVIPCPYGQPGDRLWVRETFAHTEQLGLHQTDENYGFAYKATQPEWGTEIQGWKWKSSIYMPRWASRITLEIVSVRVERLQDISEEDAFSEGFPYQFGYGCKTTEWFKQLWQSIYGAKSWDANPFVWVVEFRRVQE